MTFLMVLKNSHQEKYKKISKSNFLNKETKLLHQGILKNLLDNFNSSYYYSLEIEKLRDCLKQLKNKKRVVRPADKNVGICLINYDLYIYYSLEHLNNKNTYKEIDYNPQNLLYQ
jgi:hypothetical protein